MWCRNILRNAVLQGDPRPPGPHSLSRRALGNELPGGVSPYHANASRNPLFISLACGLDGF